MQQGRQGRDLTIIPIDLNGEQYIVGFPPDLQRYIGGENLDQVQNFLRILSQKFFSRVPKLPYHISVEENYAYIGDHHIKKTNVQEVYKKLGRFQQQPVSTQQQVQTEVVDPSEIIKHSDDIYQGQQGLTQVAYSDDKYQGEMQSIDGKMKRHGYGLQLSSEGTIYEGQWIQNQRFGFGRFIAQDGNYYVGSFSNDQYNGWGKLVRTEGSYEGQFRKGKFHGTITFVANDQQSTIKRFSGQYVDNVKHGEFILVDSNNQQYKKNYQNGIRLKE